MAWKATSVSSKRTGSPIAGAVRREREAQLRDVLAPRVTGGVAGERGLQEDARLEQVAHAAPVLDEVPHEVAEPADRHGVVGLAHDRAMAEAGLDEAAIGQRGDGLADRGAAHPEALHQVALGRQMGALGKPPAWISRATSSVTASARRSPGFSRARIRNAPLPRSRLPLVGPNASVEPRIGLWLP
jgi:hypothetical protein